MAIPTLEPPILTDQPGRRGEPPAGPTAATRYLAVGAYLDDEYRRSCLRDVYHQRRRFVAPSYGFDLITVLWHCLRARRLAIARDGLITAALAATLLLDWRAFAAIAVALLVLRTAGAARRATGERFQQWHSAEAGIRKRGTRRTLAVLIGWTAACVALAVLIALILVGATSPVAVIPAVTAVFVLPTVFALWRQKRIQQCASNRRMPPVGDTARLRDIESQQGTNTVVYGNYEPFIGAGDIIGTWGFPIRLVRKQPEAPGAEKLSESRREFDEPPFTAEEIVGYVRRELNELTTGEPERSIPDLKIYDRVFLSAGEYGERTLHTGPDRMLEIIRNPTEPARHHLVCQVVSWSGEVVTTVHVHIAVQGRSLYLEVTSTLMAPCSERYRIVDMERGRGTRAWLRALGCGIRETPGVILRAPVRLLAASTATLRGLRRSRRAADRGAVVSVRRLGTEDELRNFTQRGDFLKFRRLIETQVQAKVLDFLDRHDVDTTEFRARSASVLNVGILNNGEANVFGDVSGSSTTTEKGPTDGQ
uniref:hypothetical protein n=1 Tax=Paractinoplanes polyasparticus TaxID=2856853 RepID=UPI001C84EEB4|nr:hypothetical protein [Actinoplanes polyasparticus]